MARPLSFTLIGLELAALVAFFISDQKAESFRPEYGGNGDAIAIFLWSDRAELAFSLLAALWLLALVRVIYLAFRRIEGRNVAFADRVGAFDAHAVAIPVVGLFVGYILLSR